MKKIILHHCRDPMELYPSPVNIRYKIGEGYIIVANHITQESNFKAEEKTDLPSNIFY